MKRTLFILLALLTSGLLAGAQDLPEVLKRRGEICFTLLVKDASELHVLTNVISIDDYHDGTLRGYANPKQYLDLLKMGYRPVEIPSPGEARVKTGRDPLSPLTTWNYYPTYTEYENLMVQFKNNYPNLCHLDTIGTLASGRRLLVLKISDNVNTDESEPEFLYTSSIHGDETTGYILMMHLADYLLSNYGTNSEVTDLVNNTEIFINPLANPDGTYYGGNSSVSGARRYNINGVDMNRNYPDPQDGQHPDGNAWQPETMAFMAFAGAHHFTASVNFHGGVEVVNYPWDTWSTLHPDDSWWQYISREFADTVHLHAPAGYMDYLSNGVTNGFAWYEVNGGRQDYMNYFHHCREITIELSDVKLLPASQLLAHWDYNWRSLILLLKEARYGIHGIVTDQATGQPVAAKVTILSHDNNNSEVYASSNLGDYHRPIKAGTWTVEFSAPCYQTVNQVVTVADHATYTLNVQMVPGPTAAVTTTAASAITGTTAVSGGNVTCTGNTPVTARGVCWGTAASPTIAGPHTTNGTGAGTFTSQITGLATTTTYHVRAYATNGSGTYYGDDLTFSTPCGTVSVFPYNEGFENAGAIPACWTQEQVNASGINWTFITGSGNSHPAGANGGTYNACLKDNTTGDNKTRLISPPLNISQLPSPQLKFWHTQALWSPDQDQLAVYYRTSAAGTWTLLTTYTANITAWTQETITLPNASATYYIAFEGNAKYGYGVCVDDVQVSSSCATILTAGVTAAASVNPVCQGTAVTFTATPANGGTTPAYQWKVNANNASNATNATYTYVPGNGDAVSCVMTSNASCVTGSPATSNAVTMTVNPTVTPSVTVTASANPVEAGTSVTFTAVPVNGGATPAYQWKVNANNVSNATNATYAYVPVNGDVVTCVMTSSALCPTLNPVTGNTVTMTVNSVPSTALLQNMTVSGTQCFNAQLTISVAGNGSTFAVVNGGSATMIAGENILFNPGTAVAPGGYLYGYVSPGGPWCVILPSGPSTATAFTDITSGKAGSVRTWPNPTGGAFFVAVDGIVPAEGFRVEIFNMRGERIHAGHLTGTGPYQMELPGTEAGIFLLRVSGGTTSGTSRIVRY